MGATMVTYTIDNSVAIIKMNNPPMNALSTTLREQLLNTLDELEAKSQEVRAFILTGEGKAFMAGTDVKELAELNQETAKMRMKRGRVLYLKVERFERPFICAINGYCLGAGLELAMCCDIRIASSTAQLGQPEINVGVIPGGGGTQGCLGS